MHQHPYFAEREMIVEVPSGVAMPMRTVSSPLFFSDPSNAPMGGVPLAREHTKAVLRELGYDPAGVSELVEPGAVQVTGKPGA